MPDMSIVSVAKLLGVSCSTIRRWVKDGKMPHTLRVTNWKMGRTSPFFDRQQIEEEISCGRLKVRKDSQGCVSMNEAFSE